MRYPSTVVLMVVISAAPLFAQVSHGPPTPTPIPTGSRPVPRPLPAALSPIQLEDQWTSALVRRDTRTFDRLLAPNFVYTENASVMSRNDVIQSVSGHGYLAAAQWPMADNCSTGLSDSKVGRRRQEKR